MAWVAVNSYRCEFMFRDINLLGSIKKLIGRKLTCEDEPVELRQIKMRKVTCICDTFIKGVKFVKGCDYTVDYNPFIGIMIYAPFGYINISKWQLDNYFI